MDGNEDKDELKISLEILRERAMKIDPDHLNGEDTYALFLLLGKVDYQILVERLLHKEKEEILNTLNRLEEREGLDKIEDKVGGKKL